MQWQLCASVVAQGRVEGVALLARGGGSEDANGYVMG